MKSLSEIATRTAGSTKCLKVVRGEIEGDRRKCAAKLSDYNLARKRILYDLMYHSCVSIDKIALVINTMAQRPTEGALSFSAENEELEFMQKVIPQMKERAYEQDCTVEKLAQDEHVRKQKLLERRKQKKMIQKSS